MVVEALAEGDHASKLGVLVLKYFTCEWPHLYHVSHQHWF